MTKTKLNESIIALCVAHNASESLTAALDELTKPKTGGSSDVLDYTVFDEDDNIKYIFCTYHRKWEPFTHNGNVLFAVNEKSKNGYMRQCLVADVQGREAAKAFNASKAAIMADVLDEVISASEGKEQIAKLLADKEVRQAREDGLGEVERP